MHTIEEVEKSHEGGTEKGNPTKEVVLTQFIICDRHKEEKDGISREEIETGESEVEENMMEDVPEVPKGE
jgi:hypothetical protein